MNSTLLRSENLKVQIADCRVCDALNLDIAAGQLTAILGRNGAGKSTLLASLAGLRAVQGGGVYYDGVPLAEMPQRQLARRRGWLPQRSEDAFSSTVLETALIGRHPHLGRWDWEGEADINMALEALRAVGLDNLATRQIHSLSGGERQRLAIATLLTQAPSLYLLDEPLAHLDLKYQIATLKLFAQLAQTRQASVLLVLHEPSFALRYCHKVILLYGAGDYEYGESSVLLSTERLERLYGHPMQKTGSGAASWFVPSI